MRDGHVTPDHMAPAAAFLDSGGGAFAWQISTVWMKLAMKTQYVMPLAASLPRTSAAPLDSQAGDTSTSVEEILDSHYLDTERNFREIGLDKMGTSGVLSHCSGRVAQGESTAFTRQGSEVQILSRLPD